jgi:hypothetical protein
VTCGRDHRSLRGPLQLLCRLSGPPAFTGPKWSRRSDFAKLPTIQVVPNGCEQADAFTLSVLPGEPVLGPTITEERARELRQTNVNDELARRLHQHATEEMGYLAEILPTLYRRVTLDNNL